VARWRWGFHASRPTGGDRLDAAQPLLDSVHNLLGPVAFFTNFIQIFVLCLCWLIVLAAFFILAVQLFVALIEFKLTSLAGFVLIPFALFNRTAFLAEKVLGNVVSSGVKIMVLADFRHRFRSLQAVHDVLRRCRSHHRAGDLGGAGLARIVGLSIYGGSIANGLISGAPQLGAGAAVGTGMAVGAMGAAAVAAPGAVLPAVRSPRCDGRCRARRGRDRGCATTAYSAGRRRIWWRGRHGGRIGGMGRAVGGASMNAAKGAASRAGSSLKESYAAGGRWPRADAMGGRRGGDGHPGRWVFRPVRRRR
jgi:type IV secretion system protein TrbL